MKYIIVQEEDGMQVPVFCFAPKLHTDLATAWRRTPASRVVSAGFVEIHPNGVRTFGFSTSLNLGPRQQDAQIIAAFYKATLALGFRQ